MVFQKDALIIPDNCVFDNDIIVVNGDIIVSDRVELEYGLATISRIFIGEDVTITGNLAADEDIYIDAHSAIMGDIDGKHDVYLGDRVRIVGKLAVERDLDVGDDVEVQEGFEAKGWINIRNPLPAIIYLLTLILELLRRGQSEEVEQIVRELEGDREEFFISESYLYIPRGTHFAREGIEVEGDLYLGIDCILDGSYRAEGDIKIGENTEVNGSLTAEGDVIIDHHATVRGNITAGGEVDIRDEVLIEGDVSGSTIDLYQTAAVSGTLFAPDGVKFVSEKIRIMEEKIEEFEHSIGGLAELLE